MNAPEVPTPLTLECRLRWADEQERKAEWHVNYAAVGIVLALADGATAKSVRWEIDIFKKIREELAEVKLVAAEVREEFYAELDARMADRKKMPSAGATAEGVEKPTNQEGVF